MENIITVILVIIIIIFFILFDKKINDNFINYNITEIGTIGNDINIGNNGNLISIDSNKHILQANELCIGEKCLNLLDDKNKSLPREDGNKGICNLDQCYDCLCPAGIAAAAPECNKPANAAENNRIQCQACNRGYELVDEKCIPCIDGVNYNTEQRYTGRCKDCDDCEDGKKKVGCTKNHRGYCVDNACTLVSDQGGCLSCDAGHYMNGNACTECPDNTYNDSTKYSESSCVNCDYCNYTNDVTRNCDPICYSAQKESHFCSDWKAGPAVRAGTGSVLNWHWDCTGCPGNCGEWKRKYRTNCGSTSAGECSECPPCETGQYRINCGTEQNPLSSGTCENCSSCPPGEHRVFCEGIYEGLCIPNICNCQGGTAATGSACTSHGGNICRTCGDGYRKIGNTCQEHTCNTPMSEWGNKTCSFIVTKVGEALNLAAYYGVDHNHPHFLNEIYVRTGYDADVIQNIYSYCRDNIC